MKKFIFTEEMDNIIKEKYVNNECSLSQLAKLFGTTIATLSKHVKNDLNIEVINKLNLITYTTEEVLNLYNKGISLTQIAKLLHTDRNRLSRILKEINIKVKNKLNITKFNENVFDAINTEQLAYWLGFIFADGYIDSSPITNKVHTRYQFELSLKGSDHTHLEKFNCFMQHINNNVKIGNVVSNGKTFKRCRWSIVNKHLWLTLNNLGCIPNKSKILEFPFIFKNSNLARHFIRGYFDGDGCISYAIVNNKVQPRVSLLGTKSFLTTIKLILEKLDIKTGKPVFDKNKPDTYTLNISSKSSVKFLEYLYDNSSIKLDRKFKRFLFFKNNCRSTQEWVELLADENGED